MTSELGYIEWAVRTFISDVKVVEMAPFLFAWYTYKPCFIDVGPNFLWHVRTYISWDEKSIYDVVIYLGMIFLNVSLWSEIKQMWGGRDGSAIGFGDFRT